jgi:hypothetical protein
MAATLIVLNDANTFAAVGPDTLVLGHLSQERRRTFPLPPIVLGTVRRAMAFAAAQPPAPHDAGALKAFDANGRSVPLTRTDGALHAGAATGAADPAAVLARLNKVITHLNAEATHPNPRRTAHDQQVVDAALESGLLPIGLPTTLSGAVNRLFSTGYADSPGAAARSLVGRAVGRSPLRAPLTRLPSEVTDVVLGPGWDGRPPPIIIPHQAGWFHNLWHAVTGTK